MKNSRTRGFGKVEGIIILMIIGLLIFLTIPIYNSLTTDEAVDENTTGTQLVPTSSQWNPGFESNDSDTPVYVLPRN